MHVVCFVGTKGQVIKMGPVIRALEEASVPVIVINAAQHGAVLTDLLKLFRINSKVLKMKGLGRDVAGISDVAIWLAKNALSISEEVREAVDSSRLVIVQGDAPPALVGSIMAKRYRKILAHVEAGERTYRIRDPFPEEAIRRLVDRLSDLVFACSERAERNLLKEGQGKHIINVRYNTLLDAVRFAVKTVPSRHPPSFEFVLASIHRFETLISLERLRAIQCAIMRTAEVFPVIFPMHESTRTWLAKSNLLQELQKSDSIHITGLLDYVSFINHIKSCKFLATDGGGPQEEAYFLGTPCLVFRETTERPEFPNIFVAGVAQPKVEHLIKASERYRFPGILSSTANYSPSHTIASCIKRLCYGKQTPHAGIDSKAE